MERHSKNTIFLHTLAAYKLKKTMKSFPIGLDEKYVLFQSIFDFTNSNLNFQQV
jgi:hypothetical protein